MKKFWIWLALLIIGAFAVAQNIDVSFFQTDIRDALMQLSYQIGKPIIYDANVTGFVTLEAHGMPFEKVLDLMLMPYGYQWAKIGDVYFVGTADPKSPSFLTLSRTYLYRTRGYSAKDLINMLPDAMKAYVRFSSTNPSLIVITAPVKLASSIVETLNKIDIPPGEVLIEFKVYELTKNRSNKWAPSWKYETGNISNVTSFGFLKEGLDIIYRSGGNEIVGDLNNLLRNGQAKLLANPKLKVLNGGTGKFSLKTSRSYPYKTTEDKYSLKTVDVGLELQVVPYILGNGNVLLNLLVKSTNVIDELKSSPDTTSQSVSSSIRLRIGEQVVVGGAGYDSYVETEEKLPVLGDIPLIGYFFKRTAYVKLHKEILILIKCERVGDGR